MKIWQFPKTKETVFDYWKDIKPDPILGGYSNMLQNHPLVQSMELLANTSIIVFDHVNICYAFVHKAHEKVTGYRPADFLEKSWAFSKNIFSDIHQDFVINLSHRIIFEQVYNFPIEYRSQLVFSKDYELVTKHKGVIQCLQKGMVLKMDDKGNVQMTIHINSDITELKKPQSANLVLIGPEGFNRSFKYHSLENIIEELGPLTSREREVLNLLAKKYDSKKIADVLSISSHTVDTHRRNLLHKFNCVDTTALITYLKLCSLL